MNNLNYMYDYTQKVLKSFEKDYNNHNVSNTQLFNKYREVFKFMSVKDMNEYALDNIIVLIKRLQDE